MKKNIFCICLSVLILNFSFSTALASEYYNAIAEVNQINEFMDKQLYDKAITNCEQTIAWHNLSPDDVALLTRICNTAKKLNTYDNYNDVFDDVSNEFNQVMLYIQTGKDVEAIELCDKVMNEYNISCTDYRTFYHLQKRASHAYQAWLNGKGKISLSQAINIIKDYEYKRFGANLISYHKMIYSGKDLGNCYLVSAGITANANGENKYLVFNDGTYFIIDAASDWSDICNGIYQ